MSTFEVRQLSGTSQRRLYRLVRQLFDAQVLSHVLKIAISLVLLPLDNSIFFISLFLSYISPFIPWTAAIRPWQEILRDVQFRPKTFLITGIDTPHGLRIARCCHDEGHRVIGVDITETRFPAGESLSRALAAHYRIPKLDYVYSILDIVEREKVDVLIPCSRHIPDIENAMAMDEIESKTSCRCITLGSELASQLGQSDSFVQYLIKQDLPVVENHQVQSRDFIHRILNRSPSKVYHMRKRAPAISDEVVVLPKRTLSSTYSEVSEIQVSKDSPWLMQQHGRLGEFIAESIIIRGHVSAIRILPASRESDWGRSPLNDSLAAVIYQMMDKFASKGGSQVAGHIAMRLMVDEELGSSSVRHDVHIAGCAQGAAATTHLLCDISSHALVNGYLAILEGGPTETLVNGVSHPEVTISRNVPRSTAYQTIRNFDDRKMFSALYPAAQRIDLALDGAGKLLAFWQDWRYSITDPLPWWWHKHVFVPLKELVLILQATRDALASKP